MSIARTYHGANIFVYINNSLFGVVTDINIDIDEGKQAANGIDSIKTFEFIPGITSISGSLGCLRLKNDDGLEGRGIAAWQDKRLLEKYIKISIIDRISEEIIFEFSGATVTKQNWRTSNKDLLRGTFSFNAIEWRPN